MVNYTFLGPFDSVVTQRTVPCVRFNVNSGKPFNILFPGHVLMLVVNMILETEPAGPYLSAYQAFVEFRFKPWNPELLVRSNLHHLPGHGFLHWGGIPRFQANNPGVNI